MAASRTAPASSLPRWSRASSALARVRALPPRARGHAGRELLDRDPAAERHRRAAHGPRAQRLDPGHADPLAPHARAGARSGSSAPTTPASPRRRRSRSCCAARAPRARSSAARRSCERVWQWREQYGGTIIEQFKRLGASLRLRRRALHDGRRATSRAVLKVFVELYEQGLIYRDNYMVNWDPGSGSAISDLEVEQREGVATRSTTIEYRYSRRDRRRDGAARDDARRHGGRRAPGRRALHGT